MLLVFLFSIVLAIGNLKPAIELQTARFENTHEIELLNSLTPAQANENTIPLLVKALKTCRIWCACASQNNILFDDGRVRENWRGAAPIASLFYKLGNKGKYFIVCIMHINDPKRMRCYEFKDLVVDKRLICAEPAQGPERANMHTSSNLRNVNFSPNAKCFNSDQRENHSNNVFETKSSKCFSYDEVPKIYIYRSLYIRGLKSCRSLGEACGLQLNGDPVISPYISDKSFLLRIKRFLENAFNSSRSPRILTNGNILYAQVQKDLYRVLWSDRKISVILMDWSSWARLLKEGLYELIFG